MVKKRNFERVVLALGQAWAATMWAISRSGPQWASLPFTLKNGKQQNLS